MRIERYDELPNKPLVEAILEIKWGQPDEPDRAYPLIVGRLYERLKDDYPEVEDLPTVQVPPDMALQAPRHRFRASPESWPLVQVGPGVVTLNETEKYIWADFRQRAVQLHKAFSESLPPAGVPIASIMLQYIDAVELGQAGGDLQSFVRKMLHVDVSVPDLLFEQQPIEKVASDQLVYVAYPASAPKGQVELRIGSGRLNNRPAAVWHTTVKTAGQDARSEWPDFERWLDSAYRLADHWFFALVQGELLERFKRS